MNRAERRQLEREGKKAHPVIMVKQEDVYAELEKKAKQISEIATKETVSVMTALFVYSLNIELGFGQKRIEQVLDRVKLQFECITAGTLSGDDIFDYLKSKKIRCEL